MKRKDSLHNIQGFRLQKTKKNKYKITSLSDTNEDIKDDKKLNVSNSDTKKSLKSKNRAFYETSQQTKSAKVVQKDNTTKILSGITMVCLLLLGVVSLRFFVLDSGMQSFDNNTIINGVNVSGMSGYEAEKAISNMFKTRAETLELNLTYNDEKWSFNKEDFKVNSNIHTIISEAEQRQFANKDYVTQKNKVSEIVNSGQELNAAFNYIYTGLDEKINEIIKTINKEPVNSEVTFNTKSVMPFEITEDIDGLMVNKDELFVKINENFMKNNIVNVEIPTVPVKASVTYADNVKMTSKLTEYRTGVSDSTGNRKYNVKLALEKINGLVVQPGETVSFNKLTGPHTVAGGYKTAIIIFQGQFVDGEGGGVCQASTTLYNALLLSDIEILQVAKHTLPVKYVPLGLDAMVAEGVADLVFKNNKDYAIYIKAHTTQEEAIVEVYGYPLEEGLTLKATSEIVKKLPHSGDIIKQDVQKKYTDKVLFKGEQHRLTSPRSGYQTVSYLEYYKNGKLIDKKEIRKETYQPQQGIIIEGIEDRPTGFDKIDSNIENIKPEIVDENVFMFSMQNYTDLPEMIPVEVSP